MRGGGGGGPQGAAMRGGGGGGLRNPCLTMHQPWASLLVHDIKRVEGRSWPSPVTCHLWIHVASKVRLEGLTDFCWLCENPQKLVVPFEMRGYQGVYNLERRVYEGEARGLSPVQGPLPVKFPLPDPRNPLSLKPGSLNFGSSKSALVKTESVSAAIAGARAAATQYSRKGSSAARISSYASLCSW
ncbi:hypothetical protein D1007_06760 [Hordeum vulgare]|nr:hypothetical protein D1007_06760 [Hordeum vulgare]